MAELAGRVLAWDRVAANRRNTRLLLVLLGVLLVPVLSGMTTWVYPWLEIPVVLLLGGRRAEESITPSTWMAFFVSGLVGAATIVVVVGVLLVLIAVWRFGARRVLHLLGAQPWPAGRYPRVARALENLCLGVGLRAPQLRFIDSDAPNALAVGNSPAEATIAVSRGLVHLLDERELDGVLAHEISHVANEDTRLTTVVAAIVATLAWPITAWLRLMRARRAALRVLGVLLGLGVAQVALGLLVVVGFLLAEGPGVLALDGPRTPTADARARDARAGEQNAADDRAPARWMTVGLYAWSLHAALAPFYILIAAPAIAFIVRRAVSRQREFLADADAVLLTRDPEGLALALAKIGAAQGTLRSAESIAHLFIAPPRAATKWFDRLFPTHPGVEERIELLARMGTGLDGHAVAEAIEAGRRHGAALEESGVATPERETRPTLEAPRTDSGAAPSIPVYEQPDGWSPVIVRLGADADVARAGGRSGNFLQVTLPDGRTGWVGCTAPLAALATARGVDGSQRSAVGPTGCGEESSPAWRPGSNVEAGPEAG